MKRFAIILCIVLVTVLSACGYSEDDLEDARLEGYQQGYGDGYEAGSIEGYKLGYDYGYTCGSENEHSQTASPINPVSMPASGTILSGTEYYGSEITITADGSSSYVVSLKDYSGLEKVTFFVRAGDTVTVGVPEEYLYVYFASGTSWYGYGEGLMFGEETVYSKDDDILDFEGYTWEYTLYPVYDGNFTETPSDESEFFG